MFICKCGCGETIEVQPHHKYRQILYKTNHFQKTGYGRLGKITSVKRVQPGTKCACGCGKEVPEFNSKGIPQYSRRKDGKFFIHSHARKTKRVDSVIFCACGCGNPIPERTATGLPRYLKYSKAYLKNHRGNQRSVSNSNWKGGKWVNSNGYLCIYMPEYHLANKLGYVFEHQFVWE